MQRPSLQPSTYSGTPTSSIYSMTPSIDTATTQSTQGQRATYLDYNKQPSLPERSPNRPPTAPDQYAAPLPVTRIAAPAATKAVKTKNTLLVAVAGTPDLPLIKTYVQRMLGRATISEIAILGVVTHETAFKQLKMDMYGLAGKLGRDMGVQVYLREAWSPRAVAAAVDEVCGDGEALKGESKAASRELGAVICCPGIGDDKAAVEGGPDILAMSSEELQEDWLSSVAFVHGIAKACIPRIKASLGDGGAFFLTAFEDRQTDGEVPINLPAVWALMGQMKRTVDKAITIGRAEDVLFPEPEPEPVMEAPRIVPTGQRLPSLQTYQPTSNDDVTPPESPSKLWSMWQMQDEMGYVD